MEYASLWVNNMGFCFSLRCSHQSQGSPKPNKSVVESWASGEVGGSCRWKLLSGNLYTLVRPKAKKKICGFPVSRPYLAFGRRNPDPKLF
jgi:hypothetical protein